MTDYTPLRSQPLSIDTATAIRKTISHPTITLPLTPPATPPGHDFSKTFVNMQSQYPAASGSGSRQRTVPPSIDDSPLALPTLLSDDEEMSPAGSSGILTPPSISVTEPQISHSTGNIFSGHAMLNAFAQETTPVLQQDEFEGRGSYPLLSPQRPMKKKQMWPHIHRDISPPTTPKGHPIKGQSYFNFKPMHPITKPNIATSYTSTLSYMLRVPRRSRPYIMLAFCTLIFVTLHLSRATSTSINAGIVLPRKNAPVSMHVVPRAVATPKTSDLPSIEFQSADEELAAMISFITSTTSNVLPDVDASVPLDPSLILDFDPTHPHARDDLDLLKDEIHTLYPLILFGKMRDPWHREVKKMLAEYRIVPAPLVIELDQRPDSGVFAPLLARLLGTNELPQLTLFGKSLGSYHDVLNLREKGELKSTFEAGGLSVKAAKKNKKRVKETEREENERVLGPRPIVDGQ